MLKGNDFQQSNGLFVRVDWLSFTILDTTLPNYIISMLGYSFNDFRECPRGLHGYRKQLRHIIYPISIQYDGLEGMFVHVDISGSAIHDVIEHFQKNILHLLHLVLPLMRQLLLLQRYLLTFLKKFVPVAVLLV